MIMMKPGQLLVSKFEDENLRFCRIVEDNMIDTGERYNSRTLVSKGDVLMHVEPMVMTRRTITMEMAAHPISAISTASSMIKHSKQDVTIRKGELLEELRVTGKIPGAVFLAPNGTKIWISEHDQNNML